MSMITTARVRVTVEVRGTGSWGKECSIDQVVKQATEEARNSLRRLLQGSKCQIVGDVEVDVVTTEVA